MKKIIIICSTNQSELGSGIIQELNPNYKILGVLVRNNFTFASIRREIKFERKKFLNKIYKKFITQFIPFIESKSGFQDYFYQKNIKFSSIQKLCSEKSIDFLNFNKLNDKSINNFMKTNKPDLAIFAGGGIVPISFLEQVDVLNCHMGILPEYRGMNSWIWALLKKDPKNIGLTTHIMDQGIDTGPIIKRHRINIFDMQTKDEIIKALEKEMIPVILSSVDKYFLEDGRNNLEIQKIFEGNQYFVPHELLEKEAENILKNLKR